MVNRLRTESTAETVTLAGWAVITGLAFTVRVAMEE